MRTVKNKLKIMKKYTFVGLVFFILISCNNSNTHKEKELELKENELRLKEEELKLKKIELNQSKLSIKEAIKIAEDKFNNYLPNILESHEAGLDMQQSYTGDFTGDGIEDIAIYFSLTPKEGGNAMVGQGLSLYQNNGNTVKVLAGYEPNYLFGFDKISGGKIYVEKLEYAETDGRCCPSIKTEHIITISGNKAY
jgi:hypothetical protein